MTSIGDEYARKISDAFNEWAEDAQGTYPKLPPFDPTPLIKEAMIEAGNAQARDLSILLDMQIKFDLISPEAIKWAEKYGADQVKYINKSTKAAIRQITVRCLKDGLSPYEQKKAIRRIVGLLPQHAVAVQDYRRDLFASGKDAGQADRLADRYAKKLLNYRAETIGLTESHTATNEGLRRVNSEAVKRGVLKENEYLQEWLTAADRRRCPRCGALQGARAKIDGEFNGGGGRGPPLHPRCRCTVVLVKNPGGTPLSEALQSEEYTKYKALQSEELTALSRFREVSDKLGVFEGREERLSAAEIEDLTEKRDKYYKTIMRARKESAKLTRPAMKRFIESTETIGDKTRIKFIDGYTVEHTVGSKYADTLIPDIWSAMDRLPPKLRAGIKQLNIMDIANPKDEYWAKRYNMSTLTSAASGGGRQIWFWKQEHTGYDIVAHEAGHVFDQSLIVPNVIFWSEDKPLWQEAFKADGGKWVSSYAEESKSLVEDFADSVATYTAEGPWFAARYPARAKLLGDLIW